MTEESLQQLKLDLDEFLGDKEKEPETLDINPFTIFLGGSQKKKKEIDKEKEKEKLKVLKEKGVKPDSYYEAYVRSLAESSAMNSLYNIYDVYKKAHGMASLPYGMGETEASAPRSTAEKLFRFK